MNVGHGDFIMRYHNHLISQESSQQPCLAIFNGMREWETEDFAFSLRKKGEVGAVQRGFHRGAATSLPA